MARGEDPESRGPQPSFRRRVGRALLRTTFVYGLLMWIYLAANSLAHPETLRMPLTHFLPWPIEGDAALGCFVLSAAAFLTLRTWDLRERA